MPQLEKSKKFQDEFNKWKEVIENADNSKVKIEGTRLLEKLQRSVRSIDQLHSQIFGGNNSMVSSVEDTRYEISNLRKQIDKLVSDYKKSSSKSQ
jgi:hypothetical protein